MGILDLLPCYLSTVSVGTSAPLTNYDLARPFTLELSMLMKETLHRRTEPAWFSLTTL
jgi:hypothetical protein